MAGAAGGVAAGWLAAWLAGCWLAGAGKSTLPQCPGLQQPSSPLHSFQGTPRAILCIFARAMLFIVVVLALVTLANAVKTPFSIHTSHLTRRNAEAKYDAQGYLIKPRDWFNGLSADPGDSINDPRSVPPPVKAFAEKIKAGGSPANFAETISLIDEHYQYFEVPFSVGDVKNKPNENTGSAKVLSLGLMTRMDEKV